MKVSITMEETTEFAVHAGMFPTSMKVFRISGRDSGILGVGRVAFSAASMKVFRISGRDELPVPGQPTRHRASMKVFRISGRDSVGLCRMTLTCPEPQ